MMISKKSNNSLQTGDEETSLESSRKSCRRLQRSSDRNSSRSHSRNSNTSSLQNFYVKDVWARQINYSKIHEATRPDADAKKREPTPCKSRKLIGKLSDSPPHKQRQQITKIQKEIAISEFQQKIQQKNEHIVRLNNKLQAQADMIAKLQKQVQQKEQKIGKLSYLNQQANHQIRQLQEKVLRHQESISSTNSTLQKLKKSIQESRLNDMKKENQACKLKINQLTTALQGSFKDCEEKGFAVAQLEKEVANLRAKVGLEINLKSESMKENYLQAEVNRLRRLLDRPPGSLEKQMLQRLSRDEEQKTKLKNEWNKLMIQVDYIHRKHIQEIKLLSRAKAEEVSKYKSKCRLLEDELTKKQREWQSKMRLYRCSTKNLLKSRPTAGMYGESAQQSSHLQISEVEKSKILTLSFQLSSDND